MAELIIIIFVSFLLDLFIGDPPYKYHPIRIIGHCISFLERLLRKMGWDGRFGGIILVLLLSTITLTGYISLNTIFLNIHPWSCFFFNLYICYSCLALGDLLNHIKPVIRSLEEDDLDHARRLIALMVGRDVKYLDEQGICRAAVETMAENFVDGFFSPFFWYLSGGILSFFFGTSVITTSIVFMLAFKIASTLDSMVGYKTNEYLYFGWGGARLDDLMNYLPARVSIIFLFIGACVAGLRPANGLKIFLRDRLKHDSPNAAHAESFVAGALDIRLGGPTMYPEGLKTRPWLGDRLSEVTVRHIRRTAALLRYSAWITVLMLLSPYLLFTI